MALALVVGISVSTWHAVEATKARKAADSSRQQALAEQKNAETARIGEAAQRHLAEARAYASDMNLAQQALAPNNLGWANELLERHRPQPGRPDRRGWEWRFLRQRSRSDALYALPRQPDWVKGLSVSHDGKWLAVRAGFVSVWNLATRQQVMRTDAKWAAAAFLPTRSVLAMWGDGSTGRESGLRFWDAGTGKYLPDPPAGAANAGDLLSLAS